MMKKFVATFWRSNPQLKAGGYHTDSIIEARTIASARKKANAIGAGCVYGGMELEDIYEVKEEQA